jgi:hypothetical protein
MSAVVYPPADVIRPALTALADAYREAYDAHQAKSAELLSFAHDDPRWPETRRELTALRALAQKAEIALLEHARSIKETT